MKNMKNLTILAALAILLGALAWYSSNRQALRSPPRIGLPVLPDFDVPAADRLRIGDKENSVTIRRERDRWVVTNAFDYPADLSKLGNALLALRDLRIGHVATEMSRESSVPHKQVSVFSEEGSPLAEITIAPPPGNGGRSRGRYLFVGDSDEALLVKDDLYQFSTRPGDWMNTQILNVPAGDITRAEIIHPDGESIRLVRVAGKLEVADLAENEKTDRTHLQGMRSALSYLRFTEVADPELSDEITGLDEPVEFRVETSAPKMYTLWLGNSPTNRTGRYARIRVEPASGLSAETEPENATEGDSGDDPAQKLAQVEQEIAETQAALSGWIFLLPSYNAENMTRRRDDLVEEVPEEEKAEETKPELDVKNPPPPKTQPEPIEQEEVHEP